MPAPAQNTAISDREAKLSAMSSSSGVLPMIFLKSHLVPTRIGRELALQRRMIQCLSGDPKDQQAGKGYESQKRCEPRSQHGKPCEHDGSKRLKGLLAHDKQNPKGKVEYQVDQFQDHDKDGAGRAPRCSQNQREAQEGQRVPNHPNPRWRKEDAGTQHEKQDH